MIPSDESGSYYDESFHRQFVELAGELDPGYDPTLDAKASSFDPTSQRDLAEYPDAAGSSPELLMQSMLRTVAFRAVAVVTLTVAAASPMAVVVATAADPAEPPAPRPSSSRSAENGVVLRHAPGTYSGVVSLNGPVAAGSDSPRPVHGVNPTSVSLYGR